LDAALLALAEAETALLEQDSALPLAIQDVPAGTSHPSYSRIDRLVQVINADGEVLARSANLGTARLPVTPLLLKRLAAGETVFETLPDFGEEPTRMVSLPIQVRGSALTIQVAGSLDDVNNVLRSASILFIAIGLALILAVGAAGAVLTSKVFLTIDDVVRQARRIGEASLDERIPHPGSNDEMGRLVVTLNEMLDRLEQGFEIQRRFTSDASHELRSPLSRLRTELEVMLRRPRETGEYVETLNSCLEEVERLTRLVEELLALARMDGEQRREPATIIQLNPIAEEAIRRVGGFAKERQVQLVLEPSPPVEAQMASGPLGLALVNLLDNAVKFSPPGGRVIIRLGVKGPDALVSVADEGPGIPEEDLPHLFERFHRGAAARTLNVPGVGLGLSIVQAILHAHGGQIRASNRPEGGAIFTIHLPAAAQA
jgi:two-component system OmpR family sensor kinase